MKALFERLNYIWESLLRSELVQTPAVTASSIDEFTRMLNKSTPVTPMEKTVCETVRHLSMYNKNSFIGYLRNHNNGLILLCDGRSIAEELGINEKVDIRWNNAAKEYVVVQTDAPDSKDVADSTKDTTKDAPKRWADMKPPKQRPDRPRRDKSKYDKRNVAPNDKKNNRTDASNDKKNNLDRKPRGKKSIPPISSQEQYELLQKLKETKTFVDAVGNESSGVSVGEAVGESNGTVSGTVSGVSSSKKESTNQPPPVSVQLPGGEIENIHITNEDLIAISAVVGNLDNL